MTTYNDPFHQIKLEGVQLIEASAGTGKTFTLTTLVLRLILEKKLRLSQILAVTFTEAATEELRRRIRARVMVAIDILKNLAENHCNMDIATVETSTYNLINTYLIDSREEITSVLARLYAAIDEIECAAIYTIHGFCARILNNYALQCQRSFLQYTVTSNTQLIDYNVAHEIWRSTVLLQPTFIDALPALWPQGVDGLAKDIPMLVQAQGLFPPRKHHSQSPVSEDQLLGKARILAKAMCEKYAHWQDILLEAIISKKLHNTIYKPKWVQELYQIMQRWLNYGVSITPNTDMRLKKITNDALALKTKKLAKPITCPFNEHLLDYLHAADTWHTWQLECRTNCVHHLRDLAISCYAQHKQENKICTYDDLISQLVHALSSDELITQVRTHYSAALVDEFQDTDAKQWQIFKTFFADDKNFPLFLIGDPKQAIYRFRGGDIACYLQAIAIANKAPTLSVNYRARPALLRAIAAFYKHAGENAFINTQIQFQDVSVGGNRSDASLLRCGKIPKAVTVWHAPQNTSNDSQKKARYSASESLHMCTDACVDAVYHWLLDSKNPQTVIDGRPIKPSDLAILVRNHREAVVIQEALARLQIPATAAGKQSIFQTSEAQACLWILYAIEDITNEHRFRCALASDLIGLDAEEIRRLDTDSTYKQQWRSKRLYWRNIYYQGGPYALFETLCTQEATGLHVLFDAERRLTNYLHLAEILQEIFARSPDVKILLRTLDEAIMRAENSDEKHLVRLASDTECVRIMTMHKSKGLEFPLVFLPYCGFSHQATEHSFFCRYDVPDAPGCLYIKQSTEDEQWKLVYNASSQEHAAEEARLLYVAMTRAMHGLWIAYGPFYNVHNTAIALLLESIDWKKLDDVEYDCKTIPKDSIPLSQLNTTTRETLSHARDLGRKIQTCWGVYSFSQMTRCHEISPPATKHLSTEESSNEVAQSDVIFSGVQFGNVFHQAMEKVTFSSWKEWANGDKAPECEYQILATLLHSFRYPDTQIASGVDFLTRLIGNTLTVHLPENIRLCDIPDNAKQLEMQFQFALRPTQTQDFISLLKNHQIIDTHSALTIAPVLEGVMMGTIDLIYMHNDKWFLIDYKTNFLESYAPSALIDAMRQNMYMLQALIYTIAAHRWLRFRLKENYVYARDFGKMHYVFCRGVEAKNVSSAHSGIYSLHFPLPLINAIEALLAPSL